MESQKNKALFLDRDGIINIDTHYLHRAEDVQFREEIFDVCRTAVKLGYVIIVVTNQAGVAKGKFSEDDVKKLHTWMRDQLSQRGINISGFYYCPHHINGVVDEYRKACNCRKPQPGMILQAATEHNIDITQSLMVGDKESDRILLPGLRSVIVKSEYVTTAYDVENLSDATALL